MPFSYLQIKRSLALSLAQIAGASQDSLESSYTGSWSSMLDGAEIPLTAFKDQILMVEKIHATAIGNNPQHPARSFLYARTVDLTNLASTPTVDNAGVEIVGVWDSCADATTNEPLTWQPTQTIADCRNSFWSDTDIFYYNITGNQIRHTRPLAYLQGCSWSYSVQSAAYDADGDSPLPEGMAAIIVDDVIARSAQIGWTDAASVAQYFNSRRSVDDVLVESNSNIPLSSAGNLASG